MNLGPENQSLLNQFSESYQDQAELLVDTIKFDGEDLLKKSETEMRKMRGAKMAIVFQDPTTSLNPLYTVEKQLTDILLLHKSLTKNQATADCIESP